MKKIKHTIAVAALAAVMMLTQGCGIEDFAGDTEYSGIAKDAISSWTQTRKLRKEYIRQTEKAEEIGDEAYACLVSGDREAMKSLFSEYVLTEYSEELDRDIDAIYDALDGEIASYNVMIANPPYYGDTEEEIMYMDEVTRIVTEKGTEYSLQIYGTIASSSRPDTVGLYCVKLINNTLGYEAFGIDKKDAEGPCVCTWTAGIATRDADYYE